MGVIFNNLCVRRLEAEHRKWGGGRAAEDSDSVATEVQGFPTGLECGQVWASAGGSYGKARTTSTGWERLGRWLDM